MPRDCCPCVFHFFGMPKELVRELQNEFKGRGMQPQHIINVFKKAYPKTPSGQPTSWEWHGSAPDPVRPFIGHIYDELKANQGIIGVTEWNWRERRTRGSHCVIFAKDALGTPLLIDAQHPEMSAVGDPAILKYINVQHVWAVSVLSGKDAEKQRITIDSSGNIL